MPLSPLAYPELCRLPALRLYLAPHGTTGVCLMVAHGRSATAAQASQPSDLADERRRRRQLIRGLQAAGVTVVECREPLPRRRDGWCRTDAVVHRHKVLLALFALMAQLFPETPTVIAAEGDSALCAAALLRVPRGTTRQVVRLLAWRTTKTAGAMAPAVPMTIFDDWSLALQAVLASIDQRLPSLQFTAEVGAADCDGTGSVPASVVASRSSAIFRTS
jgi:hypothetical protein